MVQVRTIGFRAFRDRFRNIINPKPITDALHLALSDIWRAGAERFIRESIKQVLVETGMSAASFFPLATETGIARALTAIQRHIARNATSGPKLGEPTFPSGRRSGGFQDIDAGRRLGEKAFRLSFGTANTPVFLFTFQTVVFQHSFHEQRQQSLFVGEVAFLLFTEPRMIQVANLLIREFLAGRRVRRGGRLVPFGGGI